MNIALGKYRHTKSGKLYQVIGTALHTETEDMLVIYKPSYDSEYELFARPVEMFIENIIIDGNEVPRFEKIDE